MRLSTRLSSCPGHHHLHQYHQGSMKLLGLTNCLVTISMTLLMTSTLSFCLPTASSSQDSPSPSTASASSLSLPPSSLPTSSHLKSSNSSKARDYGINPSFGIFVATGRDNGNVVEYCMVHYNSKTIARHRHDTHFYNLTKVDHISFCQLPFTTDIRIDSGSYILIDYDKNCSLGVQAANVERSYPQSRGLVVSLPNDVVVSDIMVARNYTKDERFLIGLIGEDSTRDIELKFDHQAKASAYQPEGEEYDGVFVPSLMGIMFIAVFSVSVGGYYSGIVRYELFLKTQLMEEEDKEDDEATGDDDKAKKDKKKKKRSKLEDPSFDATPLTIVFFVIYMCIVLLILYFFYSYLVYMMIIFFVLFSTVSLYSLIVGLTESYISPRIPSPWPKFGWKVGVLIISMIAPVTWFFIRQSNQAWALQNALAIVFCVHVLQTMRFPNYRITSFLLSLLFFYDIFFVFLTPYLTSDGQSIMVKVATGGAGSDSRFTFGAKEIAESIPVVFQVPKSLSTDIVEEKCFQGRISYSKLGFGDVLVPGFLVSYCHTLDLFQKTPYRLYFITNCIAYAFGLVLTFFALTYMSMAQPALVYLVPSTLIPPLIIAWARGELKILWHGPEPAAIEARNIVREESTGTTESTSPKDSLVSDQSPQQPATLETRIT